MNNVHNYSTIIGCWLLFFIYYISGELKNKCRQQNSAELKSCTRHIYMYMYSDEISSTGWTKKL